MVRHVVLFKFRDGVTWDDPRASRAEQATLNHPDHIPDILAWECGRNTAKRPIAFDFALIGTFADREAVDRYLVDPDHLVGVELWRELATWIATDFVVPAEVFPRPRFVRPGFIGDQQ